MFVHRPRTIVLAALLAAAVSCSLAVGTSDIDRGCGSNRKRCGDACVSLDDPAYGCASPFCEPCPLSHAISGCDVQGCYVIACVDGFSCPGLTGCETNVLADPEHCGDCTTACDEDAGEACVVGRCAVPTGS
ncbi:MAG TPA: hypothetical protein VGM29_10915 [Polyangiaceae bacterium]